MLVEICLPLKNEAETLQLNFQKLYSFCEKAGFTFDWKIVGIINGSSDKTVDIFLELKSKYPEKINFVEIRAAGRGHALNKYWQFSQADILCYLDIDLAVKPDQLPDLIGPILDNSTDLVIGSRLLVTSHIKRSLLREITSRGFNIFSRLLFPNKVSDLQCGFKAIRADKFRKITPYLKNKHWFFDSELVILAQYFSYRVKEIPVDWIENRYKKRESKVKILRDIYKSICDLVIFRIRLFFIPKN